jgi:hypothetical protein
MSSRELTPSSFLHKQSYVTRNESKESAESGESCDCVDSLDSLNSTDSVDSADSVDLYSGGEILF